MIFNIKRRGKYQLIGILCISLILISIALFVKEIDINPDKSNDVLKQNSAPTLYIKLSPIDLRPINETRITSLVSSTIQQGNESIIYLSNGLNFKTNDTSIKSSDSIELNSLIEKPSCSIYIQTFNNTQVINNTKMNIITLEDPMCSQGYQVIQINSWHKINQK